MAGDSSITYKDLSTLTGKTKTASQMRSNAVGAKASGKDIIVTFGGLDWEVVYLSPDNTVNNNPTLTLWLSNSKQSAFSGRSSTEGEYYGYHNSSLFSEWSGNWNSTSTSVDYPAAMYGTSYMRAVTLNNGGMYVYDNGSNTSPSTTTIEKSSTNAFAKFTMDNVEGSVTKFLNTPRQMIWQQSGQWTKSIAEEPYNSPNENWSNSVTDEGFYSLNYNYARKTGNSNWADDYLWLPSLSETGYSDSNMGIWSTSTAQRQNYDGSSTSIPSASVGSKNSASTLFPTSWLRSGNYNNASWAYHLGTSGTSYHDGAVGSALAVRPALHLNLNFAARKVGIVNWDDFAADSYDSGSGTAVNPYVIKTPAQLAKVAADSRESNFSGVHFELKDDIDLFGHLWNPIGQSEPVSLRFSGVINGNNHVISNLATIMSCDGAGLISYSYLCTLQSLILRNCTIKGDCAGGICAFSYNSNFSNCILDNVDILATNVIEESFYTGVAGGIAGTTYSGYGSSYIKNCMVINSTIEGKKVGSISGECNGYMGTAYIENNVLANCYLKGQNVYTFVGENMYDTYYSISGCIACGIKEVAQVQTYYKEFVASSANAMEGFFQNENIFGGLPIPQELLSVGGMCTLSSQEIYSLLLTKGYKEL